MLRSTLVLRVTETESEMHWFVNDKAVQTEVKIKVKKGEDGGDE